MQMLLLIVVATALVVVVQGIVADVIIAHSQLIMISNQTA